MVGLCKDKATQEGVSPSGKEIKHEQGNEGYFVTRFECSMEVERKLSPKGLYLYLRGVGHMSQYLGYSELCAH